MASTKKNVQSKKRGRPPKQQPKKQTGKQTRQKYDNKIVQEAVILVLLAFCVIFFISNLILLLIRMRELNVHVPPSPC